MAYFEELPDLEVKSRLPNQSTNSDYIKIKNLWRRGKLREDIANAVTAFYYYQIEGDERPEQVAERIYEDAELDWVILLTNNITDVQESWPMTQDTLYKYLIDKYGSEEKLNEIRYTETKELRDRFNRVVIPEGLQIDPATFVPSKFQTVLEKDTYELDGFPPLDTNSKVTINLIQALYVKQIVTGDTPYLISDINVETSNLKVYTRETGILNITIKNDVETTWPSGWGGELTVYGRDENKLINIEDILTEFKLILSPRLYEVVGIYDSEKDEIIPTFRFRYVRGPN
jgi:hypothetical protein